MLPSRIALQITGMHSEVGVYPIIQHLHTRS